MYLTYDGADNAPDALLLSAQEMFGIDFVFLSESYSSGVGLTKSLPAGPYFLEPASGNIFEGESNDVRT